MYSYLHGFVLSFLDFLYRGLMAQEDLNTLGFSPDTKVIIGKDNADKQGTFILYYGILSYIDFFRISEI